MSVRHEPLAEPSETELAERATGLLVRGLGPIGTIRFLGPFRTGHGDHTEERRSLYPDKSAEELFADIRKVAGTRSE